MTSYASPYSFYTALNYPIPIEKHFFAHTTHNDKNKIIKKNKKQTDNQSISKKYSPVSASKGKTTTFSRKKENIYMQEYREHIEKFAWLYKNIPGIQSMYLCNSISFNALNNQSDIDLFIISKPNLLRRSRLWSRLLFSLT